MTGRSEVTDADGVKWRVRVQAPGHAGVDYIRFVSPEGRLRLTGVPSGRMNQVSGEELYYLFLDAILLPGRHRS